MKKNKTIEICDSIETISRKLHFVIFFTPFTEMKIWSANLQIDDEEDHASEQVKEKEDSHAFLPHVFGLVVVLL